MQRSADGFAHGTARAVATYHVAGLDCLDLSVVRRIEPLDPHGHPRWRGIGIGCLLINLQIEKAPSVVRLQRSGRFAHDVEIEIVHPCLIQNDMRKFGQSVFGVLHTAAADDVLGLVGVGIPECRLVDPAGFLQHALAETIRLEHLHRAARDAVGLAAKQGTRLLFNDAGLDIGKG